MNGKRFPILIKDILSVPGLSYNLLSVCKLEMKDLRKLVFENSKGFTHKDNETIAIAILSIRQKKIAIIYAEF